VSITAAGRRPMTTVYNSGFRYWARSGHSGYRVSGSVLGIIPATPLSEDPQSPASRVLVCADPSSRIL
jgi:hypothetical protein